MERGSKPGDCPEAFNLERPEVLARDRRALPRGRRRDRHHQHLRRLAAEAARATACDGRPRRSTAARWRSLRESAGGPGLRRRPRSGPTGGDPQAVRRRRRRTRSTAAFERQIARWSTAGVDLICVETMTDLAEATLAVKAARRRSRPELPVLATMTFDATPRGFFTIMGVDVAQAAARSGRGRRRRRRLQLRQRHRGRWSRSRGSSPSRPACRWSSSPTPACPRTAAASVVYPETPEFMARHAGELVDLGVGVIGGCCGTTPEHIRALHRALERP